MQRVIRPRGFTEFIRQSAYLWLSQLAGVVVSLVAGIIITRELGPADRGIYTWLLGLGSFGAMVSCFGLDVFSRREIPAFAERVPAIVRLNVGIILGGGAVVAGALGLYALSEPLSGGKISRVALVMGTVPAGALSMALVQVLVSQGRVEATAKLVFAPKVMLAALIVLLWISSAVSLNTVLVVNAAVAISGAVACVWLLRREFVAPGHDKLGIYGRSVLKVVGAAYVGGLSYFVMQKADVVLVGLYLGDVATGYYGVASNLADVMITPISVLAGLLTMRIASGEHELGKVIVRFVMAASAMGCLFTYAISPWLVPTLFGEAFGPSVPLVRLLCPAVFVLSWFLVVQGMLIARGDARDLIYAPVVGSLANVGLNIFLLPRYGVEGAALASIGSYALAAAVATGVLQYRDQAKQRSR